MGETNIHAPSDSRQLADSVRVLARTMGRAKTILKTGRQQVCQQFQDFTQAARKMARQIGETLSQRNEAARQVGRQKYQELLDMTEKTVAWAVQTEAQLREHSQREAQRLRDTLVTFVPRAQQVIKQAVRRVLQGEPVPAAEKIVSIFEPHTDIICRGKPSHPVEYGHKVWLNEVDGGIISHYRILKGNPPDELQWKPSLKAHLATFKEAPHPASADRGLYSEPNETLAHDLGVPHVILPKPGYRSKQRVKHEHTAWFVKGRKWHAGVEGRIRVLKRAHGLGSCLAHGFQGFQCWVGWGVIAGNLAVMGRT